MKKIILTIAASAFATGMAFAQVTFETVDADGSGDVTLTEALDAGLAWTQDQFSQADRNGDGVLSAEEFTEADQ